MLGLKQRNSNIMQKSSNEGKQYLRSGRTAQSVEECSFKNITISPWSGDDYYSKVKSSIQQQNRKRSSTAKSIRGKCNDIKSKNVITKINTVQLQIAPIVTEPIKNQWSKWQSKLSVQIDLPAKNIRTEYCVKQLARQRQRCETMVSFNRIEPIHQQKSFAGQPTLTKSRMDRLITESPQTKAYTAKSSVNQQKKSLMFFFQAKNNHNLVNRQRMIMKIRNIAKTRLDRVYNNFT